MLPTQDSKAWFKRQLNLPYNQLNLPVLKQEMTAVLISEAHNNAQRHGARKKKNNFLGVAAEI
jgi:hypothetical protein